MLLSLVITVYLWKNHRGCEGPNCSSFHRPCLHQISPRHRVSWHKHKHSATLSHSNEDGCFRPMGSGKLPPFMSIHWQYGSIACLSLHHRPSCIWSLWDLSVLQDSCSLINSHSFSGTTLRTNCCWIYKLLLIHTDATVKALRTKISFGNVGLLCLDLLFWFWILLLFPLPKRPSDSWLLAK